MRPKKVLFTRRKLMDRFQFPEVPEGYNPESSIREINPDDEKNTVVEIDGFKITNEKEEDDLATNDLVKVPEYRKRNVYCDICKIVFMVIGDAVIHVHKTHDCISGDEKNVSNCDIRNKTVEEKRK